MLLAASLAVCSPTAGKISGRTPRCKELCVCVGVGVCVVCESQSCVEQQEAKEGTVQEASPLILSSLLAPRNTDDQNQRPPLE